MHKKILIVDDNSDIRYVVRIGLQNLNDAIDVVDFENGEKCLNYLKNNSLPDLILLDIMMPHMDGWEVASKIKKHPKWKKIPIFFLTAKNDSYSKSFGKIVSNKFITKPFDINELYIAINEVIG